MKKLLIVPLVLLLLFAVAGCPSDGNGSDNGTEPPPELYDKTYITPSTVEIGGFFAGGRAEYAITIHNGKDESAQFSVTYQVSNFTREGYVPATAAVESWVTITQPSPVLAAKESRDILIILEMPEGAAAPGERWEFRIVVKDVTQGGMIQTELASRWLVDMG